MLGAISDYLNPQYAVWQIPVMAVFVLLWLLGGGFVLRLFLLRGDVPRQKATYPRSVLASLLAGAAWMLAAGVFYQLLRTAGGTMGVSLSRIGLPIAAVLAVPMFYLVIYAMYELPFGRTVKLSTPAIGLILVASVVSGLLVYLPTNYLFVRDIKIAKARNRLMMLHNVIVQHYEKGVLGRPPESLQAMVDGDAVSADDVRNPRDPNRPVGFFYLPVSSESGDGGTLRLRATEFRHPGTEYRRVVLYADGRTIAVPPEEFSELLEREENQAFAEALAEAEDSK